MSCGLSPQPLPHSISVVEQSIQLRAICPAARTHEIAEGLMQYANSHSNSAGQGELRVALAGRLVTPADPEYDGLRQVRNGSIDRHPAFIVRADTTEDVGRVVSFARRTGLELAVRGGGHSFAG